MLQRILASVFVLLWLILVAAALADAYAQTQVSIPAPVTVVERIVAGPNTTVSGDRVVSVAAYLMELPMCVEPACRRPNCLTGTRPLVWYTPPNVEVCINGAWRRVVFQ